VVTICAQDREEQRFLIFPIERTVLGVFVRLRENTAPARLKSSGRFANLLPEKPVRARDARMAQVALEAMGVRISAAGSSRN
jgi:hypothetical protein